MMTFGVSGTILVATLGMYDVGEGFHSDFRLTLAIACDDGRWRQFVFPMEDHAGWFIPALLAAVKVGVWEELKRCRVRVVGSGDTIAGIGSADGERWFYPQDVIAELAKA